MVPLARLELATYSLPWNCATNYAKAAYGLRLCPAPHGYTFFNGRSADSEGIKIYSSVTSFLVGLMATDIAHTLFK